MCHATATTEDDDDEYHTEDSEWARLALRMGPLGDMLGDIEALVARSRHIVLITLVNQGYMDFPRFSC